MATVEGFKMKFLAWDWDEQRFLYIPETDIVKAIHWACNYEFDVYDKEENLIFSGKEGNEENSEMLEPYGIRLIDHGNFRKLQNIETGEIYEAEWQY